MRDIENGVVASAAACNYGYGWEEPRCARCDCDLTYKTQYFDMFGNVICERCFEEDYGEDE